MKTLLLVDPDPKIRKLLRLLFEDEFRVLETDSGETALGMVCTERPDLVVLEVYLPDLSGVAVCRLVKSDEEHHPTKVLFLTQTTEVKVRAAACRAGADAYVTKPLSTGALRHLVRALLYDDHNSEELASG